MRFRHSPRKSTLIRAIAAVLILLAGPLSPAVAEAATSGRVYKKTIDNKYCLESTIVASTAGTGTISSHSSTSCSTASAVAVGANRLRMRVLQYTDPERDGSYLYCGNSGYFSNPVGNTWSFTVSTQVCPNPAGAQNFYSVADGSLDPANWVGTQASPVVTT